MSHLQHKSIRHKLAALAQLILLATVIHLLLLCILFVLYHSGAIMTHKMHVSHHAIAGEVPIFIVGYNKQPHKKEHVDLRPQRPAAKKQNNSTNSIQPQKSTLPHTTAASTPTLQSTPAKEQNSATTQISKAEPATKNTVPAQITPIAPATSIEKLKQGTKPTPPQKKLAQTKESVATTPQAIVEQIPPQQSPATTAQKSRSAPTSNQTEKQTSTNNQAFPENLASNNQFVVVNNYREKVALTKQYAFQKVLSESWHPPVGTTGRTCTLTLHIAHNGSIRTIETIKSSGLVMYDVQARSAIHTISIPSDLWGSSVEITFES